MLSFCARSVARTFPRFMTYSVANFSSNVESFKRVVKYTETHEWIDYDESSKVDLFR